MSSLGDALLWTSPDDGEDPMTIRDLITRYRKRLPVIVSVVDGYFGCHGQEIGSDEMYWIHDITRQKRILVCDKSHRHFSIPLDYRTMFHIATDANKMSEVVMPLGDAVVALNESSSSSSSSSSSEAGRRVLLQNDQPVTVGIGAKRTKFGRLGALKIVDTYELKYLQAHSIYEDKLDSRTTVIPSFMELTFSVAFGCRYGTEQEFREWEAQINAIGNAHRRKQSNVILCNEIILLDRNSEEDLDDGRYEYMRPMNVVLGQEEHHYEPIGGGRVTLISDAGDVQGMTSIASLDADIASLEMTTDTADKPPPPVFRGGRGGGGGEEPAVLPSPPRRPNALDLSGRVRSIARSQSNRTFSNDSPSTSPPPIPYRPHHRQHGRCSTRSNPSTPRHSPPPLPSPHRPPPPLPSPPPLPPPSAAVSVRIPPVVSTPKSIDDQPHHHHHRTPSSTSSVTTPVSPSESSSAAAATSATEATPPPSSEGPHYLRRYLFACDVPRDVDFAAVSTADLAHCLCLLSLWPFAEVFQERAIDGALLVTLDEDILRTDLGFRTSEAKKLMRFVRDKWRPSKKRNS